MAAGAGAAAGGAAAGGGGAAVIAVPVDGGGAAGAPAAGAGAAGGGAAGAACELSDAAPGAAGAGPLLHPPRNRNPARKSVPDIRPWPRAALNKACFFIILSSIARYGSGVLSGRFPAHFFGPGCRMNQGNGCVKNALSLHQLSITFDAETGWLGAGEERRSAGVEPFAVRPICGCPIPKPFSAWVGLFVQGAIECDAEERKNPTQARGA